MSHNTSIEIKVKDSILLQKLAKKYNWILSKGTWINSFSREEVYGALLKDENGQVKLIIGEDGNPVVDPYYMDYEYQSFLQEYAVETLKQTALLQGAIVEEEEVDEEGNIYLTLDI